MNINITSNQIEFTRTASGQITTGIIEPRWEAVDEQSFHVITEQGVYLFYVNENTINGETYTSSIDVLDYLNSL